MGAAKARAERAKASTPPAAAPVSAGRPHASRNARAGEPPRVRTVSSSSGLAASTPTAVRSATRGALYRTSTKRIAGRPCPRGARPGAAPVSQPDGPKRTVTATTMLSDGRRNGTRRSPRTRARPGNAYRPRAIPAGAPRRTAPAAARVPCSPEFSRARTVTGSESVAVSRPCAADRTTPPPTTIVTGIATTASRIARATKAPRGTGERRTIQCSFAICCQVSR